MESPNAVMTMGSAVGATGTGGKVNLAGDYHCFQIVQTDGGGDLALTVIIQVSNDEVNWLTPALTLSLTAAGTEGGVIVAPWKYARYNVTDIGSGDTVDIYCSTGSTRE